MQIIKARLFTILVPDKGYKLVNKNTGAYYEKIYLGVNDSPDNYGEVVDEKYINNAQAVDTLLLVVDEIYSSVEPLLMMIPMTTQEGENNNISSKLIPFYAEMINRGLKTEDEIPERFKEDVMALLEK